MLMPSRRRAIISLCLGTAAINAWAHRPLAVFLEEFRDSNGRVLPLSNRSARTIQYINDKSGLALQAHSLPWNRAQAKCLNGEGIIFGLSKTPARLKRYQFSDPVLTTHVWGIVHDPALAGLTRVEQLKGKVVSIGLGVSHGAEFEKYRNTLFRVDEDPSTLLLRFKKLLARRSDLMLWTNRRFDQAERVRQHLYQVVLPELHDAAVSQQPFYVLDKPLFQDTIHFAAAKGRFNAEIEQINQILRNAEKAGMLDQIFGDPP
jgi:ABC-type amino acid transport substrate-binding protein